MPGLVAAAPYERRMEVMRQKRQAHAAAIEAARRRGEGGARLASAATGDVAAPARGHAGSDDDDLGGSGGGSSGDEGQRGAAGSDSDAEAEQRRQGGGAGGGRKRKRQFVLEAQPDKGCARAPGGLQLLPARALPLLLASARARELPSVWPAKESRPDQCSSTSPRLYCLPPPPSLRSKYREAGFFLSHTPEENDASEKFYALGDAGFKDAVLDLTAEDAGGCVSVGWGGALARTRSGRLAGHARTASEQARMCFCSRARHARAVGMRAQARAQCHWDVRSSTWDVRSTDRPLLHRVSRWHHRRHARAVARAVPLGQALQKVRQAAGGRGGQGRQARQDGVGRQGAGRSPRAPLGCRVAGCVCRVAGSACKAMCVPSMRAKSNRVPWCTRIVDDERACLPSRHPQGKATTGLYEKWSKKTRLRVAPGGADEAGERLAAQMGDR